MGAEGSGGRHRGGGAGRGSGVAGAEEGEGGAGEGDDGQQGHAVRHRDVASVRAVLVPGEHFPVPGHDGSAVGRPGEPERRRVGFRGGTMGEVGRDGRSDGDRGVAFALPASTRRVGGLPGGGAGGRRGHRGTVAAVEESSLRADECRHFAEPARGARAGKTGSGAGGEAVRFVRRPRGGGHRGGRAGGRRASGSRVEAGGVVAAEPGEAAVLPHGAVRPARGRGEGEGDGPGNSRKAAQGEDGGGGVHTGASEGGGSGGE